MTAAMSAQSCAGGDGARAPAGATTAAAAARTCGVDARTALTGDGIGDLRVGATVEGLRRTCRVLRDTTALAAEGMHERTILVDLGRDSVTAVITSGRVWRVHVRGTAFRTADSLGVDTPASAFKRPGAQLLTGEGAVFVRVPSHCGLSFRLRGAFPASGPSVTHVPDAALVDEVLAIGCEGNRATPGGQGGGRR